MSQVSLPEIRNLLLPGCRAFSRGQNEFEIDMQVDFDNNNLLVKVYRFSNKKLTQDKISRAAIDNGSLRQACSDVNQIG